MEPLLDRNIVEIQSDPTSSMNGEEFLNLFDFNDPIFKDIDNSILYGGFTEGFDPFPNFAQTNEPMNTYDLTDSFVKDLEKDRYSCSIMLSPSDKTDTDSTSYCSENLSPRSDNVESSITVHPLMQGRSDHDFYSASQVYCEENSVANSPQTAIDIGADVVVITSEYSAMEDSNHSIPTTTPRQTSKSWKSEKGGRKRKIEDNDLSFVSSFPQDLHLTEDERKLIQKEGVYIPSHLPLTKAEEKELKRIRRKIRNKVSAQESRKRKKEYVDGLENRVKLCTSENIRLQKKVQILESKQQGLLEQIKQLQSVISNGTSKSAPTSTCLMVLFASLALFLAPSLFPNSFTQPKSLVPGSKSNDVPSVSGRVLLSAKDIDSGLVDGSVSEETINKSQEEYSGQVKPEIFQETYSKAYQSFPEVAELPRQKFRVPDYSWHSPGYQTDEAGFIMQNESHYVELNDDSNIKREIMLQ